jgi:hypothetical protein
LIKALLKKTADHGLVVFQRHRVTSLPSSKSDLPSLLKRVVCLSYSHYTRT